MTQDTTFELDTLELIDLGAASRETYGPPGEKVEFEDHREIG